MKKYLALLLVIVMAFAFGCITDDNDDSDKDNDANETLKSAENYLPMSVGSTWTYSEIVTSYWDGEPDVSTETYTSTCTGTSVLNGETYWVSCDTHEWGEVQAYLRIDGDNVYIYNPDWAMKPAKMGKQAKTAVTGEILLFKFNQPVGTTWTVVSDSEPGDGYSYSYVITGKYSGLEDVTTAAGTFANCAKFVDTTIEAGFDMNKEFTSTTISTNWLAPGVGPIKNTRTKSHDGSVINELSEMECTSYFIPEDAVE